MLLLPFTHATFWLLKGPVLQSLSFTHVSFSQGRLLRSKVQDTGLAAYSKYGVQHRNHCLHYSISSVLLSHAPLFASIIPVAPLPISVVGIRNFPSVTHRQIAGDRKVKTFCTARVAAN